VWHGRVMQLNRADRRGAGSNLRCPHCQNYTTTYGGTGPLLAPQEVALGVTRARQQYQVDRMAFSGGEASLNRPWLVQYFQALKALNPGRRAVAQQAIGHAGHVPELRSAKLEIELIDECS
jgi:pyruvate-formate lyase-activating enzyme